MSGVGVEVGGGDDFENKSFSSSSSSCFLLSESNWFGMDF